MPSLPILPQMPSDLTPSGRGSPTTTIAQLRASLVVESWLSRRQALQLNSQHASKRHAAVKTSFGMIKRGQRAYLWQPSIST